MQESNYVKKFAVISGQFLMACCLILLSSKVSYADVSCTMTPSPAADNNTVLMLAPTLTDSAGNQAGGEVDLCTSLEATQAMALGLNVEIDDAAAWGAKTQAQFATYKAIVLGDADCPTETAETTGDESVAAAVANSSIWSPAITGPVAIVGTDPVFHFIVSAGSLEEAAGLIKTAIALATSVPGKPGAYICLSCYYEFAGASTTVDVLQSFGTFTVTGAGALNAKRGTDHRHIESAGNHSCWVN
jgi:hypothetical protein